MRHRTSEGPQATQISNSHLSIHIRHFTQRLRSWRPRMRFSGERQWTVSDTTSPLKSAGVQSGPLQRDAKQQVQSPHANAATCLHCGEILNDDEFITFRVSRRRREIYRGHARLVCVCLCVCLSVHGRMPTLLHGPGCNLGEW